jgi:cytoskeletal protein RodZ
MAQASRRRRHPAHRSRRKRRAQLRTLLVLGAIGAIAVAFILVRSSGRDDGSDQTTATPSSTVPDGQTTTTAAPTSTTAALQVVASDASGSRYTVATNPFTVQLGFTGQCWVEVRRGSSTGEVLESRAFDAGESPTFTESAIWIRIGYPRAASVTVNGLALPGIPAAADPYNVEISAATPG